LDAYTYCVETIMKPFKTRPIRVPTVLEICSPTGSRNIINNGGGYVFRDGHEYVLEYAYRPTYDEDSVGLLWEVFRVSLKTHDLLSKGTREEWVQTAKGGLREGLERSANDLPDTQWARMVRMLAMSGDPRDRVFLAEELAGQVGWDMLDSHPMLLYRTSLKRRWAQAERLTRKTGVSFAKIVVPPPAWDV
jgi:hypothetical protein